MMFRLIPNLRQILPPRRHQPMTHLHRRRVRQNTLHKRLRLLPPRVLDLGIPLRGQQLELLPPVPHRQPLRPVDFLHAVEEQDVRCEIPRPVPAETGVYEVAQALEAEDLRDEVGELGVSERRLALGGWGLVFWEVAEERMLVHALRGGDAFPRLEEDFMPVLDAQVALSGRDQAVVQHAHRGGKRDFEAGHFERGGGIGELVPADVVEVAEEQEAHVQPDTAVEVDER